MTRRLRVLVADDSALMRKLLSDFLQSDPEIQIVGVACDGAETLAQLRRLRPDVVTLDVQMSPQDGLDALREIMQTQPTPTIIVSGLSHPEIALQALALGAVDFIAKPSGTVSVDLFKIREELLTKVKLAAQAQVQKTLPLSERRDRTPHVLAAAPAAQMRRVIAIAASTGGPSALEQIIPALPGDLAASVFVVQHMPAGFTRSFAERLNTHSALRVKEAEDEESPQVGTVYIARGGRHLRIEPATPAGKKILRLDDSPAVMGLRPCANVLMATVAQEYGTASIGVVLTGMGTDGGEGLAHIRARGGVTIAQDQSSSVIFGMPRAAIEAGAAEKILPLAGIPTELVRLVQGK
jgi:two-component system chemotaxis response regulator CheB